MALGQRGLYDAMMLRDWYDYPGWYDILHGAGTAREVDGLTCIESRFVGKNHRPVWLEPACGSGRYLRVAAGRGIRVIGVDLNEAMIRYAKETFARRGLKGRLFLGDMTDFDLGRDAGRVTLAFCPINSIRHLKSDRAMLDHLACVRRALLPGGVYAVGMDTCRYGVDFASEDVWVGIRGRLRVTQVVQYIPPQRRDRTEKVISHLTISKADRKASKIQARGKERSRTEHLDSTYELRSYSRREWEGLLSKAGWDILGIVDGDGRDSLRSARGDVIGGYGVYVLRPC